MRRAACLLLTLAFVSVPAYADDKKPGELTDPVEILKKVDAAARAVNAIQYSSKLEPSGAMSARLPKAEASYLIVGVVNNQPERYLADAKITMPGATESRRISAGSDNDMFFIVDHQGKKAYEDIDPDVMGPSARILRVAGMIEFIHPTPFNDEINGRSQELKGSKTVAGEDCYEVHVVYQQEQSPEVIWCFSKKDFLPRQRTDIYTMPDGSKAEVTKTITNLVVNPKVTDDVFKLKLPEGYTKTDDFAPNFLSP